MIIQLQATQTGSEEDRCKQRSPIYHISLGSLVGIATSPLSPTLCVLAWMHFSLIYLCLHGCLCTHWSVEMWKFTNPYTEIWELLSHKKTTLCPWLSLHIYMLFLSLSNYPSHSIALSISHFIKVSLFQTHSLPLSATPSLTLYSPSPPISPSFG